MPFSPPDPPFAEFLGKHYQLVLLSSAVGLIAAIRKASLLLLRIIFEGLEAFPRLHRAFYDCRIKCAENRRRFANRLR